MTAGQHRKDNEILLERGLADPYDAMRDDEFDAYVGRLFDARSGPTQSITVRLPEAQVARLQPIAADRPPNPPLAESFLVETDPPAATTLSRRRTRSTVSTPRRRRLMPRRDPALPRTS